jgi:hypothetical protein
MLRRFLGSFHTEFQALIKKGAASLPLLFSYPMLNISTGALKVFLKTSFSNSFQESVNLRLLILTVTDMTFSLLK